MHPAKTVGSIKTWLVGLLFISLPMFQHAHAEVYEAAIGYRQTIELVVYDIANDDELEVGIYRESTDQQHPLLFEFGPYSGETPKVIQVGPTYERRLLIRLCCPIPFSAIPTDGS